MNVCWRKALSKLTVLVTTLISACQTSDSHSVDPKLTEYSRRAAAPLAWVFDAHPSADAAQAIAKGDLRYWGLYGPGIYIPGVPSACQIDEEALRMMIGTSDLVIGYEHAKAIAMAQVYAKTYNLLILIHRHDLGLPECPDDSQR